MIQIHVLQCLAYVLRCFSERSESSLVGGAQTAQAQSKPNLFLSAACRASEGEGSSFAFR